MARARFECGAPKIYDVHHQNPNRTCTVWVPEHSTHFWRVPAPPFALALAKMRTVLERLRTTSPDRVLAVAKECAKQTLDWMPRTRLLFDLRYFDQPVADEMLPLILEIFRIVVRQPIRVDHLSECHLLLVIGKVVSLGESIRGKLSELGVGRTCETQDRGAIFVNANDLMERTWQN
jgi:hypothetical protein